MFRTLRSDFSIIKERDPAAKGFLEIRVDESYRSQNIDYMNVDYIINEGPRYKLKELTIFGPKGLDKIIELLRIKC